MHLSPGPSVELFQPELKWKLKLSPPKSPVPVAPVAPLGPCIFTGPTSVPPDTWN